MTNKELRKLKRTELIELMLMQSRELDEQRAQRQELEKQLESRELKLNEAGSIAEAAMEINHVFASAQSAANQYLENIKALQEDLEKQRKEQDETAKRQCADMLEEAKKQIDGFWQETDDFLAAWEEEHSELSEPLQACRDKLAKAKHGEKAEEAEKAEKDKKAEDETESPELSEPLQECRDELTEAKNGRGAEVDEKEEDA